MEWPYPTVRHMIACRRPMPVDAAYREALLRVVFALRPPAGQPYPFLLPELHVFVQLAGGTGRFEFTIELYRMETDPVLVAAAEPITFDFADRVAAYSFFRGFSMIPFARPGLYEFRLFARAVAEGSGPAAENTPRRLLSAEPLRMEDAT